MISQKTFNNWDKKSKACFFKSSCYKYEWDVGVSREGNESKLFGSFINMGDNHE